MNTDMTEKKYLIAIPCMDTMQTPFVASLVCMKQVGACKVSFVSNSLVHDARNMLAAEAIDTGADYILYIDSDMYFNSNMMIEMVKDIEENGIDFVCGLFVKRKFPTSPIIYKSIMVENIDGVKRGKANIYTDYPKDSLFEIAGCGFGAVMISTKMIKDVYDKFGKPFDIIPGILGEDLSFCYRAKLMGYKMYCDSRINVGHVGTFIYSGEHYLAQKNAKNKKSLHEH